MFAMRKISFWSYLIEDHGGILSGSGLPLVKEQTLSLQLRVPSAYPLYLPSTAPPRKKLLVPMVKVRTFVIHMAYVGMVIVGQLLWQCPCTSMACVWSTREMGLSSLSRWVLRSSFRLLFPWSYRYRQGSEPVCLSSDLIVSDPRRWAQADLIFYWLGDFG